MMDFDFSEEQQMFRSSVERFCAPIDVEARRRLRLLPDAYDKERWHRLAELGLLALAAPEDVGGMGGSRVDIALVAEAVGKANSPDPWLENGVLPTLLLSQGGAKAALDPILAGERIACFGWAERAQRYNLDAARNTATRSGDHYTLSGAKTLVLGAALADLFIVTALDGHETACFLVPADAEGLETRPYRIADGSLAGELKLNGVKLGKAARLDLSPDALHDVAAQARLYAAAEMLGLGQRLLDETLAYVKEREQFGAPIGSFQALQHRLVESYARIEQCRSMLYRAALADLSDTASWRRSAAGAKAFIGENVDAVAREAVQMHGGMGTTDELAVGHAMKRAMVLDRLLGDADSALAEYALAEHA